MRSPSPFVRPKEVGCKHEGSEHRFLDNADRAREEAHASELVQESVADLMEMHEDPTSERGRNGTARPSQAPKGAACLAGQAYRSLVEDGRSNAIPSRGDARDDRRQSSQIGRPAEGPSHVIHGDAVGAIDDRLAERRWLPDPVRRPGDRPEGGETDGVAAPGITHIGAPATDADRLSGTAPTKGDGAGPGHHSDADPSRGAGRQHELGIRNQTPL